MKIVLVVKRFPVLSETFIVSKFLGLLAAGHDVHIVCTRSDARDWEKFPALIPTLRSRVHVRRPLPPSLARLLAPFLLLRAWSVAPPPTRRYLQWQGLDHYGYINSLLLTLTPDVVHFEWAHHARGRMQAVKAVGARSVVSFRGTDVACVGWDEPGFYEEVWRHADVVHVLGENVWQRVLQRGCPPDKRHTIIPPAIQVEPYLELTRDPGNHPFRAVVVGRLHWDKGHEYVLRAVQLLVERGVDVRVKIVGGGKFLDAVAFARREYRLEQVVELEGPQPAARVREALAWADAFTLGSLYEGFCNSVIEAQAAGLPVVCTDAGGLPENIVDGETGFVVPQRDPVAMADRLERLARDPSLRARMGAAGRERARTLFRLNDQLSRFNELYRELASPKP